MRLENFLIPQQMKNRILLILFLAPTLLYAQWSADLNNPLMIEGRFLQGDPEVRLASGQYLFTWNFQYPVKRVLKALDFNGNTLWSTEKPLHSSDYIDPGMDIYWPNLFVDHANNSLLVQLMQQKQTGQMYILATKHDAQGVNLWTTGSQLFRSDCNAVEFRLAIDHNDDLFMSIIWEEKITGKTDVSICKILSNGNLQWEVRRFFYGDTTIYLDHEISIIPDEKGGCYVSYESTNCIRNSNNSVHFIDSDYHFNRITATGKIAWDKDMIIFHCNGKFFYPAATVGKDGFLYFLVACNTIQKVHPDGFAVWEAGGISITEDYNIRYPGKMEVGEDGDIRIFYISNDWKNLRLIGQRINPDGVLKWGKWGLRLLDLPYTDWSGSCNIASYQDTTLIMFDQADRSNEGYSQTNLILIDPNGKKIWKEAKSLYTQLEHNSAWAGITPGVNGQFVIAWTLWTEASDCNFYAQNIFTDGTFGTRSTIRADQVLEPKIFRGYDPASNTLLFEPLMETIQYQLHNSSGQKVLEGSVNGRVQLPGLPPGLYILTLFNHQKLQESRKLMLIRSANW